MWIWQQKLTMLSSCLCCNTFTKLRLTPIAGERWTKRLHFYLPHSYHSPLVSSICYDIQVSCRSIDCLTHESVHASWLYRPGHGIWLLVLQVPLLSLDNHGPLSPTLLIYHPLLQLCMSHSGLHDNHWDKRSHPHWQCHRPPNSGSQEFHDKLPENQHNPLIHIANWSQWDFKSSRWHIKNSYLIHWSANRFRKIKVVHWGWVGSSIYCCLVNLKKRVHTQSTLNS